jgi:hypothetical protein
MVDRRAFLIGSSVLMGHAAFGDVMTAFVAAPAPRRASFFTDAEMQTLKALVDVVLPATDSPAASAADTHYFIDLALPACASPEAQRTFREGLAALAADGFDVAPPETQTARLKARAEREAALAYDQSFFRILKDYTLTGYFLSETGATRALAYERVPGGYQGDLPLAPNQKAWAL